jgi:hypothetical protein
MITLTIEQANLVIQCIDQTIRQGGILAARQLLAIVDEIEKQAVDLQQQTESID